VLLALRFPTVALSTTFIHRATVSFYHAPIPSSMPCLTPAGASCTIWMHGDSSEEERDENMAKAATDCAGPKQARGGDPDFLQGRLDWNRLSFHESRLLGRAPAAAGWFLHFLLHDSRIVAAPPRAVPMWDTVGYVWDNEGYFRM